MIKQHDSALSGAFGPPVALSDAVSTLPFAEPPQIGAHDAGPTPSTTLIAHLAAQLPRRADAPHLLAAEHTTLHAVALPKGHARARAQMLAFAVEDQLGAPIDTLAVIELPRNSAPGVPLAIVIDRSLMAGLATGHLPEILAMPRPVDAGVWHLWCDPARILVRTAEGTGFAIRADALPLLWARAGWPTLVALHGAPGELPHTTAAPPLPDPKELAVRLHAPARDPARLAWRPAVIAAGVVVLALILHLGLVAADVMALGQRAAAARIEAELAVSAVLPGADVTADTGPLLARLAPRAAQVQGSDVIPMLSETASALLTTGAGITLRRISWGDGRLVALVLAPRLEDLQVAEKALAAAGFDVRVGAANAGDGGAEAEMTNVRAGA